MNKKKFAVFVLIIFFAILLFALLKYIRFSKEYATTDALFIRSDKITNLSFKRVEGKIIKLYVQEGDRVRKGEILAEIDPVDYKLKLSQIEKNIEVLKEKKKKLIIMRSRVDSELKINREKLIKNIGMLKEKLISIDFQISEIDSEAKQLAKDYERFKNLYKKNVVAKRDFEKIETKFNVLKNRRKAAYYNKKAFLKQIDMAKDDLKLINEKFKKLDEMEKGIAELSKEIELYEEKATDLKHSISYCKIVAPFNGKIGKKFAEVGMNVKSGYPIYSLVDTNALYAEVLLEETKLKGIVPGCEATFTVDSYPDKKFKGVVEKIYPASAATYALVPRDISAGEFTKVAQRIILRIKITSGNKDILLSGMGGEIKIKRK